MVMGCLALALSIIFWRKSRRLDSLPGDVAPSVFDRTFNVFDPYPDQIKVIHRFLTALPLIAGVGAIGLGFGVWSLLSSGLMLSIFVMIVGLNLIIIAEAPEIYTNSNIFARAIQDHAKLASGDVKVLRVIRKLAPKLGHYYLGLAIIFIVFSVTLQYIWDSLPSLFGQIANAIAQSSGSNGIGVTQALTIVFALSCVFLQFVAFKIKSRMFRYEMK